MKRYLILEDGIVFEGEAFGADTADDMGELVFSTAMCGFNESVTSPSYYGQIVMQTFPAVGNRGMSEEDIERKCFLSGYVVHEWCASPSGKEGSRHTIDEILRRNNVPGISGIDCRKLTKLIRDRGVVNALICDAIPADLSKIAEYRIKDAVKTVSPEKITETPAIGEEKYRIALYDLGNSVDIIHSLTRRGCCVISVPAFTKAEDVRALAPDGIVISDGPGDPAENVTVIDEIASLSTDNIPLLGISLGHDIMALARGGKTVKLKYGHRGASQPVRDTVTGCTYMTSQCHGYAVETDSIKNGVVRYVNSNDSTVEGIDYDCRAFSVAFSPESASGKRDTDCIYERFISMMENGR